MINNNGFARGLLDWMQDSRPVVDRATLLPIGQYEDGSLTFAWPGFLMDAWEGGQRTLLDAARAPVPDAPTGTRWSSNVDALNAASLAPMAGVAGRAAGAIPREAGNSGVLFGSKNAKIYDPPALPQRPFEADYPNGARADEAGRLTHTIDGDPIVSGATVVGRRTFGGPDEALSPAQYDAIAEGLFGSLPHYVPAGALPRGHAGRYRNVAGPDGPERNVAVLGSLPSPVRERVLAHEIGHGIEDLAAGRFGIPQDGIKRDLATVYDTLNNPNRSGAEAASWGKAARPQDFGYTGDDIPAEHMAEAIRAYLTDPNYLKTVAPKTAARIREWANTNPRINNVIQFNANQGEAALPALFDYAMPPGGLLAPQEEPPLPGLLAYFTKDRPGEPPVNTIPRGREDPFDRYNDPWGEVPMIINNPFADPPPPELPRMPRPLPFLLGPVGQR